MRFGLLRPRPLIGLAAACFAGALVHASSIRGIDGVAQQPVAALPADFFESRVRPILAAVCYDCHTDDEKGELRLDSRESVLKGGETGPAIVPGDPDNSLLIQAVRQRPASRRCRKAALRS